VILIRTVGPVSELRIQLEEMFLEVMFSTCSLNDRRDIHSLPHSLSVLQTIYKTQISSESSFEAVLSATTAPLQQLWYSMDSSFFFSESPRETDGAGFTCGWGTLFHLLSQAAGASGSSSQTVDDWGCHGVESLHTLVVHMYRYYISDTLW
jgi:hypothetical protein